VRGLDPGRWLLLVGLALASLASAEAPDPERPTDSAASSLFEKRARPPTTAQLAQRAYREAIQLSGLGREEAARNRLEAALDHAPGHRDARLALATLLAQRGQLAEAKQLLAAGREADPRHVPFIELQARILVEMDAVDEAVALLEGAAPTIRADPPYHAFLAALYQRQGKHGRAARIYSGLLRLDGRRATWWMGLGISLEAAGPSQKALAAYRGAQRSGGLDPASRRFVAERIERLAGGSP